MRTKLKIEGVEEKTSQKGRAYTSFITSEGVLNSFEKAVVDKLKQHKGQWVEIEIQQRENGYRNITGFYGTGGIPMENVPTKKTTNNSIEQQVKLKCAKDIFISANLPGEEDGLSMAQCVKLVKEAWRDLENA